MCATLLTGETACPFTEEAYTSSIPPTEREGYCYSLLRRCFTCPMHNHSHYEIALVTSGRITHFVGRPGRSAVAGRPVLRAPRRIPTRLDARDGATLVNIAFSKAHFERFLQYAADLPRRSNACTTRFRSRCPSTPPGHWTLTSASTRGATRSARLFSWRCASAVRAVRHASVRTNRRGRLSGMAGRAVPENAPI